MGKFASGKHAWGISDRSGFRYPLSEMKREWNGLLVGKDEWEAKHPQLTPRSVSDSEALKDPRPDIKEALTVPVGAGGYPNRGIAVKGSTIVGNVTVVIS